MHIYLLVESFILSDDFVSLVIFFFFLLLDNFFYYFSTLSSECDTLVILMRIMNLKQECTYSTTT